jgi:hypothetical protein
LLSKWRALHRSRRRVDLVVERQQLAAGDLLLRRAVKRIDGQLRPLRRRGCTCPRLSSGMVKMTVIGCICVITASVVVPVRLHHVAGIDQPQPTRPAIGAVMWQ